VSMFAGDEHAADEVASGPFARCGAVSPCCGAGCVWSEHDGEHGCEHCGDTWEDD
jgi:hypothetical protein